MFWPKWRFNDLIPKQFKKQVFFNYKNIDVIWIYKIVYTVIFVQVMSNKNHDIVKYVKGTIYII